MQDLHASAQIINNFLSGDSTEFDKTTISFLLAEYLHNIRIIATVQLGQTSDDKTKAEIQIKNHLPISVMDKKKIDS